MAYHYHIKILMHLIGEKALNMPYYLHKSLTKMVEFMRKKRNPEIALYHKGLIMIIINVKLERVGVPWSTFMGQTVTKPRNRVLPPKKRPGQKEEATISGCRRSTRVSRKIMGTISIIDNDTGLEEDEETKNDQLAIKSEGVK
jgi:hypothetical protein